MAINKSVVIAILLLLIILIVHEVRKWDKFCVKDEVIKKLVRQTARWATAAKQDNNAMIAVLHANYAMGYWTALKEVATADEIEISSGINYMEFEAEIASVQDSATRKMAILCPDYAPEQSVLTKIAGEGM